jgi:ATPase subunit of ABC transporter with duplicated ATPase domains
MTLLKIKGLVKSFGALQVLDQVCLELEQGELHSVIGPNGAGKTTTMKMINPARMLKMTTTMRTSIKVKPEEGGANRLCSGLALMRYLLMNHATEFEDRQQDGEKNESDHAAHDQLTCEGVARIVESKVLDSCQSAGYEDGRSYDLFNPSTPCQPSFDKLVVIDDG